MDNLTDFYPTTNALCHRLTEGLPLGKNSAVLEPSGGKGDLCDHLRKRMGYYDNPNPTKPTLQSWPVDTIEISPDLQHVLRGKGFRLIHDDFLTFQTRKSYDAIVANFPFSNGDKHLEKALDLIETNGGHLRCLINAETLRNPYSQLRESLIYRLAKLNAEVEFIADGFKDAERKTSVEVALIKAHVPAPEPFSYVLDSLKKAQHRTAEEFARAELVETDFLKQFVAHFNTECDAATKLLVEFFALRPYLRDRIERSSDGKYGTTSPIFALSIERESVGDDLSAACNRALRVIRGKYWRALFADPRFTSQYTSNILADLHRRLEELQDYDFTVFNIHGLQKELQTNITAGVEKAILDLFDKCSNHHAYYKNSEDDKSENVWYYDGWKTNKAWKINKKIILPLRGFSWYDNSRLDYTLPDTLTDMVKVFNYLAADKVEARQLVGESVAQANAGGSFDLNLRFFRIKFHKKGTAHIWFQDMDLLDKFNIFGSQRKGWLPPEESAKLREERDMAIRDREYVIKCKDELTAEFAKLREELATAREDSADLDWLCSHGWSAMSEDLHMVDLDRTAIRAARNAGGAHV